MTSEAELQRKSVDELLHPVDALPTIDSRAPDEILGLQRERPPKLMRLKSLPQTL
jgi:hypothetical protein